MDDKPEPAVADTVSKNSESSLPSLLHSAEEEQAEEILFWSGGSSNTT